MKKNQHRAVQNFFYQDGIWDNNTRKDIAQKSLSNEVGDFKTIYIHESKKLVIREYHLHYHQEFKFAEIISESRYIEMSFFLHSHTIKDHINDRQNEYRPFHAYVYFIPQGASVELVLDKNKKYQHLDMYLDIDYFQDWIDTHPQIHQFVAEIKAGRAAHLFPQGIPICPEIANLLLEIKTSQRDAISQEYFIRGKMFLLWSLLFEKSQDSVLPTSSSKKWLLPKQEQEQLRQIATLLEKNLDKFYAIEFLSKTFGINEFKLKKGFKQLYHRGIFEYAITLKMEEAKRLIADNSHTFKEIGFLLGYSAPSSFSVAFKRTTGLTPLQYRKELSVKA